MTYGFKVKREMVWDEETYTHTDVPTGRWRVELPHQCDAWTIVGESYAEGLDHDAAVVALRSFIDEANRALIALTLQEEFGVN